MFGLLVCPGVVCLLSLTYMSMSTSTYYCFDNIAYHGILSMYLYIYIYIYISIYLLYIYHISTYIHTYIHTYILSAVKESGPVSRG